jgi:heme exporter protein C
MLSFLANPDRFMAFSRWAAPMFGALAGALIVVGLGLGFAAPEDGTAGAVHPMPARPRRDRARRVV